MKQKYPISLFIILLLLSSSCSISIQRGQRIPHVPAKTGVLAEIINHHNITFAKIYSAVWMQRAAEYKGLCLQAYNLAQLRLDEALADPANQGRPLAIVTDIDETFLDNSPFAVEQAERQKLYESEAWRKWCAMAKADTLPGSLDFFKYAASKGVQIYYISNRSEEDREGTLANLRHFGYPYADDDHLLLRTTSSNKDSRREIVTRHHNVVLYLGDNLGDFSSLFDKASEEKRQADLYRMRELIGKKFILLPNPGYGTWESALMEYQSLPNHNMAEVYRQKAKGY